MYVLKERNDSMKNLEELTLALCNAAGTPGDEGNVFGVAEEALSFCKYVESDPLCGVHAFLGKEDAPVQIMFDAHIDQIGMVVTEIDDGGFIHVMNVGGIDRRTMPGSRVTVYGEEALTGIVCVLPPHISGGDDKIPAVDEQVIDIGLCKEEAEKLVSVGDRVVLTNEVTKLLGNRVAGTALDDRAGCAAIIRAAEILKDKDIDCGLHIVCSTQEEVGGTGAEIYAYRIAPTHAIAVDVSFAKQAGLDLPGLGKLAGGPMIGYAAILDRKMGKKLVDLAKEKNIPFQYEAMGGRTGTNCDSIVRTRAGVKCGLISVPQRNMHTPSEVCDLADIENIAQLMAAYVLDKGWES